MNLKSKYPFLIGLIFVLTGGAIYHLNGSSILKDIHQNGQINELSYEKKEQLENLEKKALAGDASAMVSLGEYYELGQWVKPNKEIALSWYKKAADKGYIIGMHNAAMLMYEKKDPNFLLLATRAADNKFLPSIRFLGKLFLNSNNQKDHVIGLRYLLQASQQGDASSMIALASVPQFFENPHADYLWYKVASQNIKTEEDRSQFAILESKILNIYRDKKAVNDILINEGPSFYKKYLLK